MGNIMKKYTLKPIFAILLCASLLLHTACTPQEAAVEVKQTEKVLQDKKVRAGSFQKTYTAKYYGTFEDASTPYKVIHDNKPFFTKKQKKKKTAFETYSNLDSFGRCGVAFANICKEIMPTEKRGEIGMIKPSGWHTIKYDCISDRYLYNRCHLIGYQLAGENANPKNLITGTRYLNVTGMLPFENKIADFVKDTGYHVLYRVTPIYKGDNLVAHGVLMEGYSVEDRGKGIKFCVFCYNAQPGITIDYKDGSSRLSSDTQNPDKQNNDKSSNDITTAKDSSGKYVLCLSTKKFHKPSCRYVSQISIKNKKTVKWKRTKIIKKGYVPCKVCEP